MLDRAAAETANDIASGHWNFDSRAGRTGSDNDSVRIAQVVHHGSDILINFDAQDAQLWNEIFGRIGERRNLVHLVRMFLQRDVKAHLGCAAQNCEVHLVAGIA